MNWKQLASGLIAGLFLMALGCSNSSEPKEAPLENSITLVSPDSVSAGDRFPVRIDFENSQPIRTAALPLAHNTEWIDCDSISFVDSRVVDWDIDLSEIMEDLRQERIFRLTTGTPLAAGRGILATLYLRAHGDSPTTSFTIDTTFVTLNMQMHFTGMVEGDTLIIPRFASASVHIDSIQ
jgi:hypothetical protein